MSHTTAHLIQRPATRKNPKAITSFILAVALIATTAHGQSDAESPGPSSRRTPIAISEIMYKPADRPDGRNTEFLELYNSNPWPEDISGYRLAGQVDFVFPPGTKIPAQKHVVVAAAPADMQAVYKITNVFGPYANTLKTSGSLKLHDEQGSVLLRLEYDIAAPWPAGADGTGHSIVLARPSYGENDPRAWDRSSSVGGSAGAAETNFVSTLRNVVINEVLARTDPPQVDSIELYNHGNVAVSLAGCTLSDDPIINKFILPPVNIPPRGFVSFNETQLGFSLNAAGETIYFKMADNSRVLDAVRFEAQENGISFGRFPDGGDWSRLKTMTSGTNNAPPLVSDVGFNEIMYHPISNEDDGQYVELFNHGTNAVSLAGWKIGGGISFTFPSDQVLAANSYVVVARNASRLMLNHPHLNVANTVGNFGGRLSYSGERITLAKPDEIAGTNDLGLLVTNHVDIVLDEVTYGTGGRWGRWSDGGGSSLELIDARADKRLAANWADSDETAKAPWTTIEKTGVLDHGTGTVSPLQIGLLDAGECLVDDIEVLSSGGVSCVGNGNFENGTTALSFVGNHSRSSLETNSGYAGSVALRLRTADALMTGPNAVQIALTNTSIGPSGTLRFKARWLRGSPEPLLRFRGCHLEATGLLPVPANLGTPGLPNSCASTNVGPAIYRVRHDPAVPTNNQPVVVTARVSDPDGLASLTLQYRFDPSLVTTSIPMNDAGTNGDAVEGDGVFSATLPGRTMNAIAFTVLAGDNAGASSRFPELVPDNAPDRECVVFFGEPNPTNLFGTYHLWLTRSNVDRWKSLPVMSNEDIDGTLVYNNRIIYNMGGRYSGGPFHQSYSGPAGSPCHYVWKMPKDDMLLGFTSFNQIHWPGNEIQYNDDPTLQREQAAYMLMRGLGVPWMYRRFVAVYCNGVRRGQLMEDACRPTAGTAKDQYFPDDSGAQLVKLQRWYEGSSPSLISECRLQHYFTTDGTKKTARYRPNWALKDSPGSLSDYTNVFALITAATAYNQSNYVEIVESVVDMENWMRFSVANHVAGNWDSFGSTGSGQNADAWVTAQRRWTLFEIDFSICLDNGLAWGGLFGMADTAWSRMFATPKFGRMYYRAMNELANGVMKPEVINPVMDAKYSAFLAAGLAPSSPSATKSWIASRRNSIITQLTGINATAFSLATNVLAAVSNAVTLTGTAPVEIISIDVNGASYTPVWTSLTNWSLTLPVPAGTNNWTVTAFDRYGNLAGRNFPVTVANSDVPESPIGNIVFNEIMFNAPVAEAEYIELFNRSTNTTFDLSGWVVNGIDYTFPPGSLLPPQKHLLLARSSIVFAATYDALVPVFGTFDGNLQANGETLSLIIPGVAPEPDLVVDRVRYEAIPPWPTTPMIQPGTSLQLVDFAQDNSRVANWAVGQGAIARTPGSTNSVVAALPEFPALWLNEVQLDNLTGPSDNFGECEPWIELYNSGTNLISLEGLYLGTNYSNPTQWAFPAGVSIAPGQFLVVWLDGQPEQTSGANLHSEFRLDSTAPTLALSRYVNGQPQIIDYLNFQSLPANHSYGDVPDGQPFYRQAMFNATPAGTNNAALPPIIVSINEWMAENQGGLLNPATGKYDDWFELFNPADTPASLSGYYLTDTLTNQFQYQIPAGFQVPARGFLLVWADDNTSANTNTTSLHVPFKLAKSGEAIGLFTPEGTTIDAVVFGVQAANISEGRYRDSGALRIFMPTSTPGSSNIIPPASGPPVLSGIALQPNGSSHILIFGASPGHVYRLEYKNDLDEATWHPLGTNQFATSATQFFSDVPEAPQRFYRVVLVE